MDTKQEHWDTLTDKQKIAFWATLAMLEGDEQICITDADELARPTDDQIFEFLKRRLN